MSENPTPETPNEGTEGEQKAEQTFTQADVDRIVRERVKREREKFADYDDLKAKAGEKATAEERIAALEREVEASRLEALRAKYAADVPEKYRALLTGSTDEELAAQRDLIVDRESERKKQGNHVPREGQNPQAADDPMREFARGLFARATSE